MPFQNIKNITVVDARSLFLNVFWFTKTLMMIMNFCSEYHVFILYLKYTEKPN